MKFGAIKPLCRTLPVAALLVACGGISIGVFFGTVDKAAYSGVDTYRLVVVTEPAAWANLWALHTAPLNPAPPLPAVDFSNRTVVGVFLGTRPSACYSVHIEDIVTGADRVIVYYAEREPGPNEVCAQVITAPAHIVSVTRSALPYEFVRTQ